MRTIFFLFLLLTSLKSYSQLEKEISEMRNLGYYYLGNFNADSATQYNIVLPDSIKLGSDAFFYFIVSVSETNIICQSRGGHNMVRSVNAQYKTISIGNRTYFLLTGFYHFDKNKIVKEAEYLRIGSVNYSIEWKDTHITKFGLVFTLMQNKDCFY